MPRLYFKYGTMGSSKSATALMTRFNYIEKGYNVLLLKPLIDDRNGKYVASRIGLKVEAYQFDKDTDMKQLLEEENEKLFKEKKEIYDVIIVDEAHFLTQLQVDALKKISDFELPVMCFGLKTNYALKLFEGSKRLLELSDSITEIKSICKCGKKATVNGRIVEGKIIKEIMGDSDIDIGGDDKYIGMCYKCWQGDVHYI
ncbi:MAG: thymidine kinase [Clostridia bacterium]